MPNVLLDLPVELLYEICRFLNSPHDLAALAKVPGVGDRMKEFIRVVPQRPDQILNIPPVLLNFPASTLYQPAREYTINLCEVSAKNPPLEELTRNFLSRDKIHVILILSHYDSKDYEQEVVPLVKGSQLEELTRFNSKLFVLFISYCLKAFKVPLQPTIFQAPLLEDATFEEVPYASPEWLQINPSKTLLLKNCAHQVTSGFDFKTIKAEEINFIHGLFDIDDPEIDNPNMLYSFIPLKCTDKIFQHVRTLTLDTILCLKNVHLPEVRVMKLYISGRSGEDKISIPLIQDVSAPKCENLNVKINMCLPRVQNFHFPNLKMFTLSVVKLRIDNHGQIIDRHQGQRGDWLDPIYSLDRKDFFGLTSQEIYGEYREEREVTKSLDVWPMSPEVSLVNCHHLFSGTEKFLSGSMLVLNVTTQPPLHLQNLTIDNPLVLNDLKILKIIVKDSPPTMIQAEHGILLIPNRLGLNYRPDTTMTYPQYRIKAPQLQELHTWCRTKNSGSVDYTDVAERFPLLQKLVVRSRGRKDQLLSDKFSLSLLKTLELYEISEFEHIALISSLRKSPVETLVMKGYIAVCRGFAKPPPVNLLLNTDGTTIFQDTLRSCTVSFNEVGQTQRDRSSNQYFKYPDAVPGRIEFRELPLLDHLVIYGCVRSLLIDNCPSLEGVHVGDPDSKDGADFMPLEVFEEQDDGSLILELF